jgi:hypothetical protein
MTVRFDYAGQMPRELQRTEAITEVKAVDRHTPLRGLAQSLSKRGVAEAKTELVNAALAAFVDVLFDADPDGVTPNLDADGRILIPTPWGRAGGRMFALRNTEQRAANLIMRQRSEVSGALFVYDVDSRLWLLGRGYTGRRAAQAYIRQCPITLTEWRAAWQATRRPWARQHLGDE